LAPIQPFNPYRTRGRINPSATQSAPRGRPLAAMPAVPAAPPPAPATIRRFGVAPVWNGCHQLISCVTVRASIRQPARRV